MEEELIDLDTGIRRIIREEPPPRPKPPPKPRTGRTMLRQGLSPYLPPPLVRAMAQMDPLLEPYVGPEASITLLTSLLVAVLLVPLLQSLAGLSGGGSGGKAIADDEDDDHDNQLLQADDFGDTVILCGPMWAGKTRILYHLCHGPTQAHMPTVMSLRANVALLNSDNNQPEEKPLRVLDYPGHSGLQDALFSELLQSSSHGQLRIVLVVDATQPLASAADFLYDLLQYAQDMPQLRSENNALLSILVACHKCDLSSSKNPRRIKISLRTELEKLLQVKQTVQSTNADSDENNDATNSKTAAWWKQLGSDALDLDQLPNVKLQFESTTCNVGDGIDALREFCKNGIKKS